MNKSKDQIEIFDLNRTFIPNSIINSIVFSLPIWWNKHSWVYTDVMGKGENSTFLHIESSKDSENYIKTIIL